MADDALDLMQKASVESTAQRRFDQRNIEYYEGTLKLRNLGLSVHPNLQMFETRRT